MPYDHENRRKDDELGIVRQILRSEITWTAGLIVLLWSFVVTVVLPIQKLQIQVTQIQDSLVTNQAQFDAIEKRVGLIEINDAALRIQVNKI